MTDLAAPSGDGTQQRHIVVVVVHGVGDTQPGLALNEVVDTLQSKFADELEAKPYSEVYRLAAAPMVDGGVVDQFPAHARTIRIKPTGDEVRFYDLHWADLSRSAPGRLSAFLGSFRIIFESHHFIDAMLPKDAGRIIQVLRTLLIWAAALLRGPIVGLSACLVVTGLAYYSSRNYLIRLATGDASRLHDLTAAVFALSLLAALLAALVFLYARRGSAETEWKDVLVAIVIGTVFLSAYGFYLYYTRRNDPVDFAAIKQGSLMPPMCLYVTRLYYVVQNLRVAWCALVLLALAIAVILYLRIWPSPGRVHASAAMAAVSVVVLQSALWLSLISAISIPLIHQANLHERLRTGAEGNSCELESLYVSFLGTAGLLASVGYVALLTYAARFLLARLPLLSLEQRARLMPRMLFGGMITLVILAGTFLQLGIFGTVYINDVISNGFMSNFALQITKGLLTVLPWPIDQSDIAASFERLSIDKFTYYGIAAGAAALVSGLMVVGFTTAIHITRDLIDYQYSPRLGYSYYVLPQFLLPRCRDDRPRRARIRERLNTLTRDVICKGPSFTDVVFVAHSQGSVIVYDYLRTGGKECERLLGARPHLITFGSPLGHLYQFYFREYGDIGKDIADLRPKLSSWTNLYRVDDYVGRRIRDADGFIHNRVIRAGGHINYWCEPALSDLLLDRIRRPAGTTQGAALWRSR